MDDNFFYRDLAGKRHLRSYLKASILIVIFMALALAWGFWQRAQMMAVVNAPARPVVWEPTPTPIPPTATPTATPEPCPSDPSDWKLLDVFPDDNYKRIEPACVYAGLERTVAWALAINLGYTRAEAAQALGFEDLPLVTNLAAIKVVTNFEGPMDVQLNLTPYHPDFATWRVTANEKPAITYSLRGCFRTYTIVGNHVEDWGTGYPVICVLAEDMEGIYFASLDGNAYTPGEPTYKRATALFGYTGNNNWIWIGTERDTIYRYPIEDAEKMRNDRQWVADLYGATVWEAAWLEQTFGLIMRPLPENWQSLTSEADKQAVLNALSNQGGSP